MISLIVMYPQFVLKFFYPLKYNNIILRHAKSYDVDPYLVMAVIKTESGFKPDVESHKGAKGLMQITDSTALWGAEKLRINNFKINMLFEPDTNIEIGCWYLNQLMAQFDKDIHLVLAAYNGGSGNVMKWLNDVNLSSDGKKLGSIPFKETEEYVKRVAKHYNVYKKLYLLNVE
jgi:soluble lytic murein transglycosylase